MAGAKKDSKFRNLIEDRQNFVTLLITTEEHLIKGKLYLPIPSVVENPTTENLLFYALNCGKYVHFNSWLRNYEQEKYWISTGTR